MQITTGDLNVIEARTARFICAKMGFHMRRDGDYLHVYEPVKGLPVYMSEANAESHGARLLTSLYVDEGLQEHVLYTVCDEQANVTGFVQRYMNHRCDEMVDATVLIGAIVEHVMPDAELKDSPYIGRGRSKRHYLAQYAKLLRGNTFGDIEFV